MGSSAADLHVAQSGTAIELFAVPFERRFVERLIALKRRVQMACYDMRLWAPSLSKPSGIRV